MYANAWWAGSCALYLADLNFTIGRKKDERNDEKGSLFCEGEQVETHYSTDCCSVYLVCDGGYL